MKRQQINIGPSKIAIIGLGYVGLPLAVEFAKQYPTTGFDIKQSRIDELKASKDSTLEVAPEELRKLENIRFTTNPEDIRNSNIFIVTVPTPIDEFKRPDLSPLQSVCRTISVVLKKGDIVIFESTVFPGATEEVCMPILEEVSGLKFNQDFFLGYSPERLNRGDKNHRITDIEKMTSGSTPKIADFVDQLYAYYLTHRATQAGYNPEIILAGRRLNDSMADYVADKLVRKMSDEGIPVVGSNVLIMVATFKGNCPDTRNSQVFRVIELLKGMNAKVEATDPWVDAEEAAELGLMNPAEAGKYDAIMIAVAHRQFIEMGAEKIRNMGKEHCVIFDQQLTDVRL